MTDREFWKSRERCYYCHKKDAFTMVGRSLCAECAEKERIKKQEKYDSDPEKFKNRNKYYYNLRKDNKLCVKCGQPLEFGNTRVRCLRCTRKLSSYDRKTSEKNRPPEQNFPRGDNGVCYMCNRSPALQDMRCCASCYEKLKVNMLKAQSESTRKRKERGRFFL